MLNLDDLNKETRLSRQWHLRAPVPHQSVGINAVGAWAQGEFGRPEIKVVVFDTGVDIDHPNLRRNLDLEAARDFDHGLEEDGRALTAKELDGLCKGTLDGSQTKARISNPYDAHGTAGAGIVAADGSAGGCVGIAPRCKIVAIRINTNFEFKSLLAALAYAETAGHVILMPRWLPWAGADPCKVTAAELASWVAHKDKQIESAPAGAKEGAVSTAGVMLSEHDFWQSLKAKRGKDFWEALRDRTDAELSAVLHAAIKDVATRVPIVCASGNNGTRSLIYPACLPETIAVGACNERGYRSTYSQYGEGLDVMAPSNDIAELSRTIARATEEIVRDRGQDPRDPKVREKFGVDRLGHLGIETTDHHGPFGYVPNPGPLGDYCTAAGAIGGGKPPSDFGYAQSGLAEDQSTFAHLLAAAAAADAERPDWLPEDFRFGGTSAAAAQVAGVIALMLSASLKKCGGDPDAVRDALPPETIRQILKGTAKTANLHPEPGRWGFTDEFGAGLVDAADAVEAAVAAVKAPAEPGESETAFSATVEDVAVAES